MATLEKLLYLVPGASFSIWATTDPKQYGGAPNPTVLDGCFIDWNPTNTSPCPTQAQINAVNAATAVAQYQAQQQALSVASLMQNPTIASNYHAAVAANATLTPAAYIAQVQAVSSSVTPTTINTPVTTQTSLQTPA